MPHDTHTKRIFPPCPEKSIDELHHKVAHHKAGRAAHDLKGEHQRAQISLGHRADDQQREIDEVEVRRHGLEAPGGRVEARQAVARAVHDADQLRQRVEKVEDLRNEEEQQRLGKVPENAADGKGDAGKVGKGVADKDARRKPEEGRINEEKRDAKEKAALFNSSSELYCVA